ncbi:hypothetical protein BDV93DRAFT_454728 [Ceratobasidium sp. AG-I]|nr:hypothetical protein BDV93DRAFT_454728 [Ceratobasidium sp. AG-I]
MVADYVSAEEGWLCDKDGQQTHKKQLIRTESFQAGKNRDGYFTNAGVAIQLRKAIELMQCRYPLQTHVFIYDNVPSHSKAPVSAVSAKIMTKGPKRELTFKSVDAHRIETQVRMEDGRLSDGSVQSFYFPVNHPKMPGWFKGMAAILVESNLGHIARKRAECPKKCSTGVTNCCCHRPLSYQPDVEARDSIIEELAEELGSKVIFLPKFHCELNPIEQCWGMAKEKYWKFLPSSSKAKLEENMLAALSLVPHEEIQKFAAQSRQYLNAYAAGMNGKEAAEWVHDKKSKCSALAS